MEWGSDPHYQASGMLGGAAGPRRRAEKDGREVQYRIDCMSSSFPAKGSPGGSDPSVGSMYGQIPKKPERLDQVDVGGGRAGKRGLTFHCLEFENGVLRQSHAAEGLGGGGGGAGGSLYGQSSFIPSEYQMRLAARPPTTKRPRADGGGRANPSIRNSPNASSDSPKAEPSSAALEAASILLDLLRS